ncbi:hypothetical protein [Niveibacterium sp. SC-1]|uniref:hypothetical protein n=1 Tax=Niveibacterium sp. SC-1 TaxID=3135646 RepID=UPI00311F28E9
MADPPLTSNLGFLTWVRQGAATGIAQPDTLGPVQPGRIAVTAAVRVNNTPAASLPVQLLGPADVLGLDLRQVVRTDPPPNSSGFEPNNFVAIEFDRPDLPWLFTPAAANSAGKLRPWLCLVVVRVQPGVTLRPAGDGPLPVLDIAAPAKPVDELPDLAESWLWAHAQVAAGDPATVLAGPSQLSLSRLWCPRLLEADTDYLACLVPSFALGVMAGLGQAITEAKFARLDPAWPAPARMPAALSLPVYHHWAFRSGAGGDFKSLVQLLKAQAAPEGLGRRPVNLGQPGFPLPGIAAETAVELGGALQDLLAPETPEPWPAGAQAVFQPELAKIVNAPGLAEAIAPEEDPLLAPPLYGRWHAARTTANPGVPPAGNPPEQGHWFDELNLDPRHRLVAAFGTQVVQEHQEALMAAAWTQAGELQRANQTLRQLQLGIFVSGSLHARHFARLSLDALVRVSGPVHARIRLAQSGPALRDGLARDAARPAPTLAAQLSASTLPPRAASAAMRRMTRPLGPVNRRLTAMGIARPTAVTMLSKFASGAVLQYVAQALPDVVTFNTVRERLANPGGLAFYQAVSAQRVQSEPIRPFFTVLPEGQSPTTVPAPLPLVPEPAVSVAFRKAATEHLALLKPNRIRPFPLPLPTVELDETLQTGLLSQLAPQRTLAALARARVPMLPAAPALADEAPPVEPLVLAPHFTQPMYEPLRDLSQALLLPGLEAVDPNSVIGLKTNRRFVEAYLVGLNHEMGRELLWRGFPTDQRGTCFDRFWDNRGAPEPRPDITQLHTWGNRLLGDAANAPARERFVMLLRSELLRRYPGALIYALRARRVDGVRSPSPEAADELMPAFRGSMQPDISFFGFDLSVEDAVADPGWYIVLQEQPTEPRLGLEADTPRPARTHMRIADGAPAGVAPQGLTWGASAAAMAGILRQVPVRIAIHASQFLPRD